MNIVPAKTRALQIKHSITQFWSYCEQNDFIPTIETLALYLDTTRKTLWEWEHSNNTTISKIVKKTKNQIFHAQKQLAMRGKMNSAIFIFNAINNYDYVQKVEHEHNTTTDIHVSFNVPKVDMRLPRRSSDNANELKSSDGKELSE